MLKFWNDDYRSIRIQSTICEQKNWDRLIQDLDYDFLMNLALGHKCVVYDFGAKKPIPRAVYQGLEFVKYVLNSRWLDQEYITNVNRSKNQDKLSILITDIRTHTSMMCGILSQKDIWIRIK